MHWRPRVGKLHRSDKQDTACWIMSLTMTEDVTWHWRPTWHHCCSAASTSVSYRQHTVKVWWDLGQIGLKCCKTSLQLRSYVPNLTYVVDVTLLCWSEGVWLCPHHKQQNLCWFNPPWPPQTVSLKSPVDSVPTSCRRAVFGLSCASMKSGNKTECW